MDGAHILPQIGEGQTHIQWKEDFACGQYVTLAGVFPGGFSSLSDPGQGLQLNTGRGRGIRRICGM